MVVEIESLRIGRKEEPEATSCGAEQIEKRVSGELDEPEIE